MGVIELFVRRLLLNCRTFIFEDLIKVNFLLVVFTFRSHQCHMVCLSFMYGGNCEQRTHKHIG